MSTATPSVVPAGPCTLTGSPSPTADQRTDPARLQGGEAVTQGVTKRGEQLLGCWRLRDQGVEADRLETVWKALHGEVDPQTERDCDASAVRCQGLDLAEDAGELATIDKDVVGPLEAGGDAAGGGERIDERQPGREGDSHRHGRRATQQERREQR